MDGVASSVTARLAAPSSRLAMPPPRQKTALPVVLLWGLIYAVVVLSVTVLAQDETYPVFTADQLDATMKTLGPNIVGVRAAVRDQDYATAKARGIRSREQLATTVTFWRDQERDDAVAMLRAVTDRLDALDGLLSTPELDAARVGAALVRIQDGCAACHRVYREQDSVTGAYRLRQSAVRGL